MKVTYRRSNQKKGMDDETRKGVFLIFIIALVLLGAYLAAQGWQGSNQDTATYPFKFIKAVFAQFI
jgi:hypothetical protein